MMWDLIVCRERLAKQGMVMKAVHQGMGKGLSKIAWDEPRVLPERAFFAGQLWAVTRLAPKMAEAKRPFWMIDNGYYHQSGKGQHETGHWEFTYRGLEPILMNNPSFDRFPPSKHLKPWKRERRGYVLIGHPGPSFGVSFGFDMKTWSKSIVAEVRKRTNRPILERTKWTDRPLAQDLAGAAILVTHSSHVVIDAIRSGVLAIVAPSSPAAPVASHNLDDIENPIYPDREQWWASLMCQQFTLAEIARGTAWAFQEQIMEQVDGL